MTVPAAVTTYRYEGNGVTAVFAYSNRLLSENDITVQILTRATDAVVETLTLTTDYTVTIVSNSLASVTITNPAKIPSGTQDILLNLDIAISQTREYPRADSLPAAAVELGLDKLTLIAQKIDDRQGRSLRFPDSDLATNAELPGKTERALTYLAFDEDGVPIASASAAGGAPAGAFGAQVVATTTQAAAQTLIGIANAAVTTAKIADSNVTTAKILDANVTNAKLANMAANTVKVNATAGAAAPTDLAIAASQLVGRGSTGNVAAITLGTGLSMSGTTLNGLALTQADNYELLTNGAYRMWGTSGSIAAGADGAIAFPVLGLTTIQSIQLTIASASPDNGVNAPQVAGPNPAAGFSIRNKDGDSAITVYWQAWVK